MLLSAEVRWFWQGPQPQLSRWFAGISVPPGDAATRVDTYLVDRGQTELGIKSRGSNPGLEIKVLVSERAPLTLGAHAATSQIWTKVTTTALTLDHLPRVSTHKKRWLRSYSTLGCHVEFTEVRIEDLAQVWVTLGVEAYGSLDRIESSLRSIVQLLDSKGFPDVGPAVALSYPQWLAQAAP